MTAFRLLALETTQGVCSVALLDQDSCLAHLQKTSSPSHNVASFLVPWIQELLESQGNPALQGIAVCRGPGSFTGVRLGLAAAQGLALGYGIPLFGVDSFSVIQESLAEVAYPLLVVQDTKCQSFYAAFYETEQSVPHFDVIEEGHPWFLEAQTWSMDPTCVIEKRGKGTHAVVHQLDAQGVGEYVRRHWKDVERFSALPFYLKPPNICGVR